MSGIVFIISAPSGSGKSTLTNRLLSIVPDLKFSVSYTTRPSARQRNLGPRILLSSAAASSRT